MSTLAALMAPAHDCADCHSETRIVHIAPNVHVIEVAHDDSCPTLHRIEGNA